MTGEKYSFCEQMRASLYKCDRFMDASKYADLQKPEGPFECSTCGRERDPGKCWWCGNN